MNILKKINYLFDFKYYDDALKVNYSFLNNNEKVIILNRYYNYYISIQDYYKSLKIARDMVEIVCNNNFYSINDIELIKRLYPQHFKDLIVKYSNEFNVDIKPEHRAILDIIKEDVLSKLTNVISE